MYYAVDMYYVIVKYVLLICVRHKTTIVYEFFKTYPTRNKEFQFIILYRIAYSKNLNTSF